MRVVKLEPKLTKQQCDDLLGKKLDDSHYDLVLNEDTRIEDDQGNLLGVLLKKAISREAGIKAYTGLLKFNSASNNRGTSTDGDKVGFRRKKDGSRSKTRISLDPKLAVNGIIGYFDRSSRFPYCRQCAFTEKRPKEFALCMPYFREASELMRQHVPDRWQAQKEQWDLTSPDFRINDTVFTTVTVNKNYQTACHLDVGDLKEGISCLGVLRRGKFSGGLFVIPRFRVALNLDSFDVAFINPHEHHGNTPIEKITSEAQRISMVLYYRTAMTVCGTLEEELERAKNRKLGEKLND